MLRVQVLMRYKGRIGLVLVKLDRCQDIVGPV